MPKPRKDYDGAVKMYNSGLSIQDCADYYGITRQAMWAILKRRQVAMRPQSRSGSNNHFHRGGARQDSRASNLTMKAISKGTLIPEPCEICGVTERCKDGRNKIHAHHDDYSKPLEVRWLCKSHHHEWHKNNTARTA